jgi:protein-L-isoaspartate(D-aspartate) O-methyltransferase
MTVQLPIPDFAAARAAMVDSQLRPEGVTDPGVIEAMATVAREKFLPEAVRPLAYTDRAIALGDGRFVPPPATLGKVLTQMAPRAGQRALVVGAGSGYSSAVLARIGLETLALESSAALADIARGHKLNVVEGPLDAGWSEAAPYDLILIDGAVETIPEAIISQLAEGGQLGASLIERGVSRLIVGRKRGGAFGYLSLGDAGTPALPGFSRPKEFTF